MLVNKLTSNTSQTMAIDSEIGDDSLYFFEIAKNLMASLGPIEDSGVIDSSAGVFTSLKNVITDSMSGSAGLSFSIAH